MELFYHATRDIELPRSLRPARVQAGVGSCEACGAGLEGAAAADAGTYGLAFCDDCRARIDLSAIQIHFCDGCGVSVPLDAVEGGAALTADGQILCSGCRPGRGARLAIVAVVVLAVAAGAAYALFMM